MLLDAAKIVLVSIFLAWFGTNEQGYPKLNSMLVIICYEKLLIVNSGICNLACKLIVAWSNNNLFLLSHDCYYLSHMFVNLLDKYFVRLRVST